MHSYEELNSVFEYKNGKLFWKISPKYDIFPGMEFGSWDAYGYREGQYQGIRYKTHRIIYFLHTRVWPPIIDHVNQNRGDNRFENLRDVPQIVNCLNSDKTWGKSGFRGVCWIADHKKYRAHIRILGKSKHIGYFDTAEEASNAYQKYKQIHTAHLL